MSKTALRQLLLNELKDLLDAEKQLTRALPKMAAAAANHRLRTGFERHLLETRIHLERLEKIFRELRVPARGRHCPAMKGLIEEGSEAIEQYDEGPIRDAALIGSAQRIEHYEIAAYGTVRTFAEHLGLKKVSTLLQMTLDEEGATNKKLTNRAKIVNTEALALDD